MSDMLAVFGRARAFAAIYSPAFNGDGRPENPLHWFLKMLPSSLENRHSF